MEAVQEMALIPLDALNRAHEVLDVAERMKGEIITPLMTADQAVSAASSFRELGALEKEIDAARTAIKKPHLDACREIDKFFGDIVTPIKGVKGQYDQEIRGYNARQEAARQAEQRRLNEIAERERTEKEARARQQREQEETARRAEEDARARAASAKNAEERAAAQAEAEKRRREAEAAAARAALNEAKAESIVAPIAQSAAPKLAGVSTRSNWTMAIDDPIAFVNHCATNGLTTLLMPNSSACNNFAKLQRKEMTLPGARIYDNAKLSGRSL